MNKKSLNLYQVFLHFILVLFGVIIILLVIKINKLQVKPEFIEQLKEGESFLPMDVQSLDGTLNELIFSNKLNPTLLFIFTTTCPYCSQNIPNWKRIYEQNKDKYEIIGIGADELDNVKEYANENKLPYKIFVPVDKDFRKKYKISGVPQTIIVDTNNRIKKLWLGKLNNSELLKISDKVD